jgi:multisubunit Na+/H+ antiporter MnhB subunit
VQRAYLHSTRVLSALVLLLGIALVVVTLASGGGGLARGVVLGVLIAGAGAGRLWLATRQDHGQRE